MPQASAAAVDHERHLPFFREPKCFGHVPIVDLVHVLNFQKMVARAQSCDLFSPPLFRGVRNLCVISLLQTAVFFTVLQVFFSAIPILHCPARARFEDLKKALKLATTPNYSRAFTAGFIAAIAGSLLWFGCVVASGIKWGLISMAIGYLVGYSVVW